MNEAKAREVLRDAIEEDGSLYSLGWYLEWKGGEAILDGSFSAEDLEAIVWWMRKHPK